MFFVVPLAHEHAEARRWPVVTSVLIALNVLVFVLCSFAERAAVPRVEALEDEVAAYVEAHPYLRAPEAIAGVPIDMRSGWTTPRPPEGVDVEAEQRHLDALVAELEGAIEDMPVRRFGFVARRMNLLGLLTSQFMHGGVLHLAFNMWFMWLCACNLEDRWGRLVFPCFFLLAGIAAALTQTAFAPDSPVPMIGASGAVAGAMGAFLITHARTRVTLFYLYLLLWMPRWGTFRAPAWVVLVLWLLGELVSAGLTPAGAPGVAHWAHVGGFAFGVVAAFGMRASGLDRRLDDAVEKASVLVAQDPRVLEAAERTDRGDARGAIPILEGVLRERPRDLDANLELLRAAKAASDAARERASYGRLVGLYAAQGMMDAAADLLLEAHDHDLAGDVPRAVAVRIGAALASAGATHRAAQAYRVVLARGIVDAASAQTAMASAELAVGRGRRGEARSLALEVQASPHADAAVRGRADRLLRELGPDALEL